MLVLNQMVICKKAKEMNDFMKMLAISCASVMVITNYGTAQNCVRPVQGFVSLGVYGAHSKIDGKFSQLDKLKDADTLVQLEKLTNGKFKISKVDTSGWKKAVEDASSISMNPDNNDDQTEEIEFYAREAANTDKTNNPATNVDNNVGAKIPWEQIEDSAQDADDRQRAVLDLSQLQKNNDGTYTVTAKFNMKGAPTHIVPVGSALGDHFIQDADGEFCQPDDNTNHPNKANADIDIGTNLNTYYDDNHNVPTLTLKLTPKLNINGVPTGDFYTITTPGASNKDSSSSSSWTGKKWQMAGFANLGLLVNFSQGGAWYLSVFGTKPFVNSTQNITFGDTSSNTDNNSNSIDAKEKWGLGIETGLRCNINEKVYLGIGGGVQWSWYEFSLKNNSENKNNNDSSTSKQDMKGTAPFMKLSLGFNINKNFGVEIFGKYTGKHDLKYKDSKKSDDKNNNSSSKEWQIDFTKQGSPSFGIAATFTF